MKKSFNYILILGFIGIISCDKENKIPIEKEVKVVKTIDANGVSKTDSVILEKTNLESKITKTENKIQKQEYVYRAFDGTEAKVTFTKGTKEGNFILIERNKLKIELPQIESDIYEKDGIKAVSKGDLLTITQNGQIFELYRKK
ncbi:DUF1655 domain-containing protein [Cloacibacterium normanense]|uniref:DUF1655 domain-containing protein n=1 Tax=Cloacibacterium normanense TaxID=237258 RepID=UPI0035B0ED47